MISYLTGELVATGEQLIVKTASGVGFRVTVGGRFLSELIATQSSSGSVELFTYTYLREDRCELYGVRTLADLKLLELLISVSGLGPKTAVIMLDTGTEAVIQAVQKADLSFFTNLPRVGKKLAQKIIIELKSKLGGLTDLDLAPKSQNYQDVMAGLATLGFEESQIANVLRELGEEVETGSTSEVLKLAIKKLNR